MLYYYSDKMQQPAYQEFEGGYYMTEPGADFAYEPSNEPIGEGLIDEDGHLQVEDLWGVQKKTFNFSIKGSLEEFANNPEKAVWTLPAEAHRFLQKVTTNTNRTKAKSDDLAGDLSRTILLKATVKEVRNEFPVDIGLDIHGLMPNQLTENGRHNFVIYSNTQPMMVNEDIFEPDSIFSKYDYSKYGKLTPDALAKEITFPEHDKGFADIKIGGIAWDLLIRNAQYDHFEPEVADELLKLHDQLHSNPFTRKVQVPEEIGRELFDAISAPLAQIDKSFVDMRRMQGRFMPTHGEQWNSFTGLIGDSVGLASDDSEQLKDFMLTKESKCSAKVEFHYVCF